MKVQPYSHDEIIDWLENTTRGRLWREDNIKQMRYVSCWAWLKSVPGGDNGDAETHPTMRWTPPEFVLRVDAAYADRGCSDMERNDPARLYFLATVAEAADWPHP